MMADTRTYSLTTPETYQGKTFTMMGKEGGENPELRGLIPRISEALFEETKQAEGEAPMVRDTHMRRIFQCQAMSTLG